jgi:hypothetical protein
VGTKKYNVVVVFKDGTSRNITAKPAERKSDVFRDIVESESKAEDIVSITVIEHKRVDY